jgi:hypothetical protein
MMTHSESEFEETLWQIFDDSHRGNQTPINHKHEFMRCLPLFAGFADSRLASTDPAVPAPITM